MQKIEVFRASNGFAIILGHQGTAEMLVFETWKDVVEYLTSQAGLWGKRHVMPELSPNWETAPPWATSWESKACWIGDDDGEVEYTHRYEEERH